MLIYKGIITLDYTPATDVLVANMPDVRQSGLSETNYCLKLIVDTLRNYDIKHLVLDCSKTVVDTGSETYKSTIGNLCKSLMGTRLKKIAQVGTAEALRQGKSFLELRQEFSLPIEFSSFSSQAEAVDWLLSREWAKKVSKPLAHLTHTAGSIQALEH